MADEPRFLGSSGAPAPEREPVAPRAGGEAVARDVNDRREPAAANVPNEGLPAAARVDDEAVATRNAELRRELEAAIEQAGPARCAICGRGECRLVYALVEHSSYQSDVRYRFMRSEAIVRSSLAPYVFLLCTACFWRASASRSRVRRARFVAGAGLVLAMGYFVAALAHAPSVVAVSLLFGGIGVMGAMFAVIALGERALLKALPLPALPGRELLVLSTDRGELDRMLERRRMISLEIQNEIDRMASSAAVALPTAKLLGPRV